MSQAAARERIILSIDTSRPADAEDLARIACREGLRFLKMGTELATVKGFGGWDGCSQLADQYGCELVADAKLNDVSATIAGKGTPEDDGTIGNIINLARPPFGITIHTTTGFETLQRAQQIAKLSNVMLFGVTLLTHISDREHYRTDGPEFDPGKPPKPEVMAAFRQETVLRRARLAVEAGLGGIVCSALELDAIRLDPVTRGLSTLVPGTRSEGASHGGQSRVATPGAAIRAGARLVVAGSQVTKAREPARALRAFIAEVAEAIATST